MSSRFCFFAGAAQVSLEMGWDGVAHVGGVKRCASPWSCPTCSPVVRQRRAGEIDQGLTTWVERGGGVEFVTITLRHGRRDALSVMEPHPAGKLHSDGRPVMVDVGRLGVMTQALGLILNGSGWKRKGSGRRNRLGYVGSIRALEMTWGEVNGWHPHVHAVLLFARPLTEAERQDLGDWMHHHWAEVSEAHGFGTPTREHGVRVEPIRNAADVAGYLAKVEGGWGPGMELARGDLKRSHGDGTAKGMQPLQLLERLVETGESKFAALWMEYEAATFGKQAIRWSPGLKELLGVQVVSDEEAATVEAESPTLLRALIEAPAWNPMVQTGAIAQLQTDFERVGVVVTRIVMLLGGEVRPLDDRSPPRSPL